MKQNTFSVERGREIMARVMEKRLNKCAIFIVNGITASFGSSGVTGKRGGSTKKDRRKNRSKPYGPPNVDTGHLKRNTTWDQVAPFERRIGTGIGTRQSVGYAKALEFGTRHMLPRPFLRPAMSASGPFIEAILGGKL